MMECRVTATVTVTEKKDASGNYLGEYEYTVTYTSTDGQDHGQPNNNSSAASNDTEFNNVIAQWTWVWLHEKEEIIWS